MNNAHYQVAHLETTKDGYALTVMHGAAIVTRSEHPTLEEMYQAAAKRPEQKKIAPELVEPIHNMMMAKNPQPDNQEPGADRESDTQQ